MKLFAMEKELRIIKNRGHFPIQTITPQGTKIETSHDKDKVLEAVNMEVTEMMKAVRQSEENYESEQEQAKNRDEGTCNTYASVQIRLPILVDFIQFVKSLARSLGPAYIHS